MHTEGVKTLHSRLTLKFTFNYKLACAVRHRILRKSLPFQSNAMPQYDAACIPLIGVSPMLTKNDLIQLLAERMAMPKTEARANLNALIDIMADALKSGNAVMLTGIGKIMVQQKASRTGVDPRSREPIVIPASRKLKIVPSNEMINALNK